MSKSNAFENSLLLAVFNAVAIAGLIEDHSSPVSLEVALHTANPDEGGSQTTNESTYTGYARVTVARTAGVWTVTGNSVTNVGTITFPECTEVDPDPLTHFSVGLVGSDTVLYYGALGSTFNVNNGITPSFAAGTLTITED